jgi:hypothetical protein
MILGPCHTVEGMYVIEKKSSEVDAPRKKITFLVPTPYSKAFLRGTQIGGVATGEPHRGQKIMYV